MIGDAIIHKTALGLDEIESRALKLPPILRALLIMIDGKSSYDQLYKKVSILPQYSDHDQFEETMETLLKEGLISDGSSNYSFAPDFHNKDGASVAEKPGEWSPDYVLKMRRKLLLATEEILGNQAEKVINKLENAPVSKEGLVTAVSDSKKLVRLFIDEKKADELEGKLSALLNEIT